MLFTVLGSTVTFSWQGNFELPMNHAQIAKEALNMRIATLSSILQMGCFWTQEKQVNFWPPAGTLVLIKQ